MNKQLKYNIKKELDLAMAAIKATRRQVNADLDAIEARIRRAAMPESKQIRPIHTEAGSPDYWRRKIRRLKGV